MEPTASTPKGDSAACAQPAAAPAHDANRALPAPAASPPSPGQSEFALESAKLTWAALLGRWIDFARSAVALPATAEGRLMRDSIADVIMLQAVWFALRNLGDLPAAERALGLDRAQVLIDRHSRVLRDRWGRHMPSTMAELIADAHAELTRQDTHTETREDIEGQQGDGARSSREELTENH